MAAPYIEHLPKQLERFRHSDGAATQLPAKVENRARALEEERRADLADHFRRRHRFYTDRLAAWRRDVSDTIRLLMGLQELRARRGRRH